MEKPTFNNAVIGDTDTLKSSSTTEKPVQSWPDTGRRTSIGYGGVEELGSQGGHVKEDLSALNMVAVGFNICNSWVAIASTLAIAVTAGGPVTLIYGIIIAFVIYACVAASLAELASIYPTAGGQYHFTSVLAPKKWSRGLSYTCGAIATFSWCALTAAATILGAQMILAIPAYYIAGFVPQSWHYFVVYQAINLTFLLYNLFLLKATPWVHNVGFGLTLSLFVVIMITCIALSEKQTSAYVFTTFDNGTGWNAGVTFLTGLSTPCFMYAGLDAGLHLAETCTEPKKVVPRALMSTVLIGFITGFGFAVAMCYSISDLDALLDTTMPIYELWRQATGSPTAATVFLVALTCIVFFAVNAMQQTAAHLIWAFGRDRGIVFSTQLATTHKSLGVPVWALFANSAMVFLGGIIYLASSAAFNALINSSIILQIVSFAIPCALLLIRGRSTELLPADREFKLPAWLGWSCNIVTVFAAVFETLFFDFPAAVPVTGSTMSYTCVVLAVIAILSGLNWVFYARKNYAGPRKELY